MFKGPYLELLKGYFFGGMGKDSAGRSERFGGVFLWLCCGPCGGLEMMGCSMPQSLMWLNYVQ